MPKRLVITNSSRRVFFECPRSYYYKYERLLQSTSIGTALLIGNVIHEGLALLLHGEPMKVVLKKVRKFIGKLRRTLIGQDLEKFEKDATIVEGMLIAWDSHRGLLAKAKVFKWDGEPAIEVPFEVELPDNIMFSGKLDTLCRFKRQLWLGEHKTAGPSTVDGGYVERLYVDHQIVGYTWAAEQLLGKKLGGVLYNVLGKPGIRQRTKKSPETLAQFTTRLTKEYKSKPTQYLYSTALERRGEDVDNWPNVVAATAKLIREARETGVWLQHDHQCVKFGQCAFLPLCAHGDSKMNLYTKRDELHPELDN